MKNNDRFSRLLDLAAPIGLMVAGLILIFAPDTGSILLSRLLGGLFSLAGIAVLLWAIFTRQWGKLVLWFVLVSIGSFLLAKPLALAAFVGRILGVLIFLESIREVLHSASKAGRLLSGVLVLVGVVLIFMPMSASRLIFAGCGVVLLLCGVGQLVQKRKGRRYLENGRDDIIDAL